MIYYALKLYKNKGIILNQAHLKKLKLLILDVDGVLTDGRLYFSDSGDEIKAFHSLDGHGITMLRKTGVKVALLTGRQSKLVALRAQNLHLDYVYQGARDKLAAFESLLSEAQVKAEECAYVGDDVIDLPPMRRVAFAIAVRNAASIVKEHAHYITVLEGGCGAVREVCDLIMRGQGTYDELLAHYLR